MILTANVDFNDLLITTDAVVRHWNAASAVLFCLSDVLPCRMLHHEARSVPNLLANGVFGFLICYHAATPGYVTCMAVSVATIRLMLQAKLQSLLGALHALILKQAALFEWHV
jgi:hypothetical protein